jgi:hypothetical protein
VRKQRDEAGARILSAFHQPVDEVLAERVSRTLKPEHASSLPSACPLVSGRQELLPLRMRHSPATWASLPSGGRDATW